MPTESITLEVLDRPLTDLVTWLPIEGKKVDFASLAWQGNTETLMCTHPKNPAILQTMIDMIASAKHSVLLFNWMLNHPDIEKSLVAAANRLNGRVHVLTTLGTSIFSRYSDEEQAEKDLLRLQTLAGNGVYIRLHPESHAKFLIVDDELLITSANIVKTSLEENIETGIRVNDANTVRSLHVFFSYLWLHEANQHIRPSKNDPRLGNPWSQSSTPDAPVASANAIWTLSKKRMSLAKAILDTIKSAKKTLRISTYVLSNAESGIGKQLVDELVKASEKGVAITILYHATDKAIGRPPREHEANGFLRLMSCKGVSMRGHPDLHAKHVIADNDTGLLFTANLDGSHGLNSGIEVGTHLSKEASQHLAVWHDNLFESFPLELVYSPTSTELANRGGTKLLELNTTFLCSSRVHASVKDRISKIAESPVVLCKRDNRWIPPETKRDRLKPKPYEPRVAMPSIKSGYLVGGLKMIQEGKIVKAELSNSPNFGLHHAHVKPGKYLIELIRPFSDDEVLEMIEFHLPAPEKGVVLKEIIKTFKEATTHPEFEIEFPLTAVGLAEYIDKHTNKGLLRTHELQGQKLMPVLSLVEAAELLKDILDSGDKEEMQKVLDKSKKPHNFTISKNLIKKLKKLLPEEVYEE
ncbi:MAG: phosphatidylserine/phosphatidylglycerophosphate/cardiolipin synthase family protein [Flavobacteriales bacterium]|nr:phosphatidylserine/phosphatidylglycerophosphate/cardiolipin synthase family protein [Euryarchaeota archaeon]MBT6640465.1 phosphatidylserine/phosphatidylglycerophosphate/cardiolipin synthase family protein [Euryarchaeota archaeon]MBT6918067.1 phosphatidylserine/phosphatidylglycerophosphate/cardiolipin synthase family protein [Flavobacteriales bacterium]MBT7748489.1 phosphatidylserine/phosphatidylglycerophosphate/cardiolipin synthase family protein [Flavobacteriales bacterium]